MPTVTHCLPRVTPGLSAALARVVPAKLLIKVDLPTLGMPTTITRIRAPAMPFPARFSKSSRSSASMALRTWPALPFCFALMATQPAPAARKYACHARVRSGSARSALFITYKRGFAAVRRCSSGLRLLKGIRASRSWSTTSTFFKFASMSRRVLAMWPGNHWMLRRFTNSLLIGSVLFC